MIFDSGSATFLNACAIVVRSSVRAGQEPDLPGSSCRSTVGALVARALAMKLDQEVRHKSEDIDGAVLLDAVQAIRRRVKIVNREYDIPYIAGYSLDGDTVFIDRHLPKTFRWITKTVRVDPFLLTHEIVEKALLDELRLHYLHAHQIAVRAERDAVKAAGVSWWAYQRFVKKYEKPIEKEKLVRVPSQLDLTPYRDEKDFGLLRRLVRKAMIAVARRQKRCCLSMTDRF